MSEKRISPRAASKSLSSITSMASDELPNCEEEIEFEFGLYKGEVDPLSGLRSGQGELRYNNGNIYRGNWLDGAAHGYGEKLYANGDVYRGSWRSGKRCGKGGYLHARGHYFEGEYKDDTPNGYGVLRTLQGDCYTGQWKCGRRHGVGKERLSDGTCYMGQWRDGEKCGSGVLCMPGAQSPIRGIWRGGHYIGEAPACRKSGKEEFSLCGGEVASNDMSPTRDDEGVDDKKGKPVDLMDLSEVSNSVTEKASRDLNELEMRLEAVVAAMERAGIPDIT